MQNDSPVDNFWAEMHLDGAQVDQLLCKPGEAKIFEGFKEGGKISEFLFALPRFQRATDGDEVIAKDDASGKSRLSQLGSLTIRTFPAEYKHDEDGVLREFGEFRQERFCCCTLPSPPTPTPTPTPTHTPTPARTPATEALTLTSSRPTRSRRPRSRSSGPRTGARTR